MTINVHRSHKARYLVIRVPDGESIPSALAGTLQEEGVTCGWLSGGGVLADVELRAYSAGLGALGGARRIEGPVQVIALEGSVGLEGGEVTVSLRAMLGRETDRGLETLSGEIASARSVALELFVTALEDVTLERSLDEAAGVWMLGGPSPGSPARPNAGRAASPAGWSAALEASERDEREPRTRSPVGPVARPRAESAPGIPQRPPPARRPSEIDTPYPEQGDSVDHFAFGTCDVVKSDGDRLHLKIHKDGRIREIALAMLRVSRLGDAEDGRRRFKLERRM